MVHGEGPLSDRRVVRQLEGEWYPEGWTLERVIEDATPFNGYLCTLELRQMTASEAEADRLARAEVQACIERRRR